jgi:hypothetical protein
LSRPRSTPPLPTGRLHLIKALDGIGDDAGTPIVRRLRDVGELLGIPLLDHVIICSDGNVSIATSP